MKAVLPPEMLEATRLTRAGRLNEASALLQRALRGETAATFSEPRSSSSGYSETHAGPGRPRIIDVEPEADEAAPAQPVLPRRGTTAAQPEKAPDTVGVRHAPEVLRNALNRLHREALVPGSDELAQPTPQPAGARFLAGVFSAEAGSRSYKLYIPAAYRGMPAPLLVMLHGCTQSPDDFAAGTRMNALAEEHGALVLYPMQPSSANAQKCWNWFSPGDQVRGRGEPSLIAGMTLQIMREQAVDPRRVFVAGLSAGGAVAAIMGQSYPELYAAVGVHSGLACGAARDIPSAFAAMRQGAANVPSRPGGARPAIPTIVFHADRDATVHPRNGDQVMAQSEGMAGADLTTTVQRGQVEGGHAFTRTIRADAEGRPILEQWLVHGGGHAWSGGSPAGTYTDPRGPDASREMLRFFLEHSQPTSSRR